MTRFICETCGTQFADTAEPPQRCAICEDERQYVGWKGQTWTTHNALAAKHKIRFADDSGIFGIGLSPGFAIDQRAAHLPTDAGNILWECLSIVTPEAVAELKARGGVDIIIISHPHFYASMVEWSDALGGVPILLHEADKDFVLRPSPRIEFWSGDTHRLSGDVALIRTGGHFTGSTALHWRGGPTAGGSLFSGDAPQVVMDRRDVTFMYSFPNQIPMKSSDVRAMRERLAPFAFENVYGYTWGRNIVGGGREAVARSFERHLKTVNG